MPLNFPDKSNLITPMRLIDELNTFYNTNSRILDLTNGRLPAVHMVTKRIITSHQFPCNTSIPVPDLRIKGFNNLNITVFHEKGMSS